MKVICAVKVELVVPQGLRGGGLGVVGIEDVTSLALAFLPNPYLALVNNRAPRLQIAASLEVPTASSQTPWQTLCCLLPATMTTSSASC